MNSKEFKNVFDEVAKVNGFLKAFGGWFKESPECIAVLELQKSNFGDYYQLNIKIFIQGAFEKIYSPSKELVKSSMGHINGGESKDYKNVFDFDEPMDDIKRKDKLEDLFQQYLVPFIDKALSKSGILELASQDKTYLLPAVKQQIDILTNIN